MTGRACNSPLYGFRREITSGKHHALFNYLQQQDLYGVMVFMHPGFHMVVFQTHILSLNASVEAASAGVQGKGFAVVASEVRTLAIRCETAAKDIRQLISSSVECTRSGSQQVEHAGKTMQEIISSIDDLTDLVGELTVMSEQQRASIARMRDSIASIDRSVQDNVDHVAETVQVARKQQQQADALKQAMDVFRFA